MEPVVFYDAIHGFMDFNPLVIEVINTIQFQRLRNIKQLGLCYFVYPSASHNRFEHCLGTCFLAGKMARHLLEQKDLELNSNMGKERLILCVEIAGLCHDLGHCPYSHLFQQFVTEQNLIPNWNHEEQSCKMFDYLLDENEHIKKKLEENERNFIKSLIKGDSAGIEEPEFLFQIINNSENSIDVDKWDYLARDSHFLGFGINFHHDRLITFSKVIDNVICFRDKTVHDILEMFHCRFRLHKLVYQHKTVLLFNELFKKALEPMIVTSKIEDKIKNMEEFTYFTDNILEDMLSSKKEDFLKSQGYLKDIIERSYTQTTKSEYDADKKNNIHCKASYDYGNKDKNPLEKVKFYKKGKDEVFQIKSIILPKIFAEKNDFYFKKKLRN
ncbi:deoxynucleoside triphosphate triphosphohydrolase SAMHD1-like [Argonauta hians]